MSISLQGPGLWYAPATGLVSLLLLTLSVLLGSSPRAGSPPGGGRGSSPRACTATPRSWCCVPGLHVGTTVIDTYIHPG